MDKKTMQVSLLSAALIIGLAANHANAEDYKSSSTYKAESETAVSIEKDDTTRVDPVGKDRVDLDGAPGRVGTKTTEQKSLERSQLHRTQTERGNLSHSQTVTSEREASRERQAIIDGEAGDTEVEIEHRESESSTSEVTY